MTDSRTLRTAQQYAVAARAEARNDNPERADFFQERAETLYEKAGLDADWHDDNELAHAARRLNLQPKPLLPAYDDGTVAELSDDLQDSPEGSGIVITPDSLVPVRD